MKKLILSMLLMATSFVYGQSIGLRYSAQASGISMSVPLQLRGAITKGSVSASLMREGDRNIIYFHYSEKLNQFVKLNLIKNLYTFVGAGLHMGVRETTSYKGDANTIFLAGATAVVGVKYDIKDVVYISADMMPRFDFPFFGGCEMHKKCGEMKIGAVNFSIGVNLK